jgi:formyltetrahydrofolate hydrolase
MPSPNEETRTVAENHASLIVQGKDKAGIVAAITSVLTGYGANIVSLDQYSGDPQGGDFFQRTVFSLGNLKAVLPDLDKDLQKRLEKEFELSYRLYDMSLPKRLAIFASKADHCLLDLLWRQRNGELPVTVSMVISNHPDLAGEVRRFGIPFFAESSPSEHHKQRKQVDRPHPLGDHFELPPDLRQNPRPGRPLPRPVTLPSIGTGSVEPPRSASHPHPRVAAGCAPTCGG